MSRFWLKAPVAVLSFALTVAAQDPAISLIFPQVADGRQPDGLYYVSRLWVMSLAGGASCTLSLNGMDPGRLPSSPQITVPAGGWAVAETRGVEPIATGYARLDCSQPVIASMTYSLLAPAGETIGMATVLPSPFSSYAMHPLLLDGTSRYGIALANDSDAPAVVNLFYTSSTSGDSSASAIQIPPRSHYSGFVDQVLALPVRGTGTLEIEAVGTGAAGFRLTALLFNKAVCTTLVPAAVR